MIPFFDASTMHQPLSAELEAAFQRVMTRSSFVLGEEVTLFEQEFADYCESQFCTSVGNGLDALVLVLRAWGIGQGDEVIVPGQTFVATWLAVSAVGATPIPVDVDLASGLLDITKVSAVVTENTKAVIPVHLFGQAVDIVSLKARLPDHVKILEDAAQAHGAMLNGRKVGSLGDAAAFSFYPTKNLGCLGDGGAVTTNDPELAKKVAMIRNYGSRQKYLHEVAGVNSRLDELQAAFLRIKLPYLNRWNASRKSLANCYSEKLATTRELKIPSAANVESHVFHLYVVTTEKRDELQKHLQSKGITSLVHYPIAPSEQPIYSKSETLENSLKLAATSLSLPLWPNMPSDYIDVVANSVRAFFEA